MPAFIQKESGDFADTAVGHDAQAILEVAERLFAAEPDWIVFFREIMGLDGIVRRTYQTPDSLMRFECSTEYARIREMLDALRQKQQEKSPVREAQRVVTVRMPMSLHETLKAEAQEMNVSINKLCISKLLKLLDENACRDLVPEEHIE
jgi:predicted HicB family RNase H-like nuclease